MSVLSDSGFEEDFHSPSPSSSLRVPRLQQVDAETYPLLADWQLHLDYDETCFTIQKHCEKEFLTRDCLIHQPQVSVYSQFLNTPFSLECDCE